MAKTPLSVLTWNINFRDDRALGPLASLSNLPDVVTLQEVKLSHETLIRRRLEDLGYAVVFSGDSAATDKRYATMVGARGRLAPTDLSAFGFPWPQLVAHATLATPGALVNLVTVHVPNGSGNGWTKIDALEALRRLVLSLKGEPLVLTGDFNEPRFEKLQDGRIVTWGQEQYEGRWLPWTVWTFDAVTDTGDRWDAAVRWFFEATDESGIRNAFWDAAGHGAMAASHYSAGKPRWFDHVFVSDQFQVKSCKYLHSFREDGFSDHSALLASLSYALGE